VVFELCKHTANHAHHSTFQPFRERSNYPVVLVFYFCQSSSLSFGFVCLFDRNKNVLWARLECFEAVECTVAEGPLVTCLSLEIFKLRNIKFEKDCNLRMTLWYTSKVIITASNWCYYVNRPFAYLACVNIRTMLPAHLSYIDRHSSRRSARWIVPMQAGRQACRLTGPGH